MIAAQSITIRDAYVASPTVFHAIKFYGQPCKFGLTNFDTTVALDQLNCTTEVDGTRENEENRSGKAVCTETCNSFANVGGFFILARRFPQAPPFDFAIAGRRIA